MKTENAFTEIDTLESELRDLAPLVRQAFSRLPPPSDAVTQAIHDEARRALIRKRARLVWPYPRVLAAAAAFALLMGGGIQLHLSRQDIAEKPAARAAHKESTSNLATLLLEIQGLNEDGFFRPEEAEPLWL
jgi:hypothetical protein